MLAAGYTLLNGEHVKIDDPQPSPKRTQIWIDVFGFVVFLTPVCVWPSLWYGIPFFLKGFNSGEVSSNAGGLIRWPVYLMMPLGFWLADAAGRI